MTTTEPPDQSLAGNALQAEATGTKLILEFRGHTFELDPAALNFEKAAFAINVAMRGGGDLMTQASIMLDAFESILGKENLTRLYESASDLFSSAEAQKEFWEAFAKVTVGAPAGESPAS